MLDPARTYTRIKLVSGVAVPLLVLSVALGRVDLELLAGAVVTFGGVFGLVYAYARYVDIDPDGGGSRERRRGKIDTTERANVERDE